MDPDYFVLDTFRVPGLNTLMQLPSPPTMIACMTTFCIEAIRKMPEYWWLRYSYLRRLFLQGVARAYGKSDDVFVNGRPAREYLRPLQVLRLVQRCRAEHASGGVVRRSRRAVLAPPPLRFYSTTGQQDTSDCGAKANSA